MPPTDNPRLPDPRSPMTDMDLNIGHGHVFPRPDGVRARCGGPPMCRVCAVDMARTRMPRPISPEGIPHANNVPGEPPIVFVAGPEAIPASHPAPQWAHPLIREYRPSMDNDVMRAWAQDIVQAFGEALKKIAELETKVKELWPVTSP